MPITADQAFEARDAGEPVMISAYHAIKLVISHDQSPNQWEMRRADPMAPVDLADVLEWLGY